MKKPELIIEGRKIGEAHPPLVIAEIGINHEGRLDTAIELVDSAKRAGVECVKFQSHIIDDEMCAAAKTTIPGNATVSIYDIMKRCALSEADEIYLQKYVARKGMIFLSTPFSRAAANRLKAMDISAYKIGSGECNNYPLIKHIASFGKPIILSTGMNSLESIAKSVAILRDHKLSFALMHCTSMYPTPYTKIRLNAIDELRAKFPDAVLGLSDHSLSNYPCLGAVVKGASILERHYTDHKRRMGPDIQVSMTEEDCAELIRGSRILHDCLKGKKEILPEEKVTIDFAYSCVVSTKTIKIGEPLTEQNIWVKRPGTGEILAEEYETLLGKIASTDIPSDTQIKRAWIK